MGESAPYAPFLLDSEVNLRGSIAIINLKKDPYFSRRFFMYLLQV